MGCLPSLWIIASGLVKDALLSSEEGTLSSSLPSSTLSPSITSWPTCLEAPWADSIGVSDRIFDKLNSGLMSLIFIALELS